MYRAGVSAPGVGGVRQGSQPRSPRPRSKATGSLLSTVVFIVKLTVTIQ